MNERTTLEKIAPSVEEAVAEGLAELGVAKESVTVEVLDGGSRGIFGVGSRQARVRLTLTSAAAANEPINPREQEKSKTAGPKPAEEGIPSELMDEAFRSLDDNLLFVSRQTVAELLEKMKIQAKVEVRYGEPDEEGQRPVHVNIHGSDLGVLIGRKAEILNAMQYITNLIVSKQVEHWVQIIVDVEGYRARREQQLRQMARRMADQAIRTGRRQVLEPMAPSDRRIVHLELRDHPRVLTQSIGEEPARKVTIVPK